MTHHKDNQRFQKHSLHLTTPYTCRVSAGLLASLFLASVMLWMPTFANASAAAEQMNGLLALVDKMESSYSKIEDYSAVFTKHERVKDVLLPKESIFLKFKKPLQIYMRWIDGPIKEAIYVEGTNGNKVIAHSGASLTWNLDPNGSILIAGNRHPITDIGFGFILNVMRTNIPLAIKHAEIELSRFSEKSVKGRPVIVVEAKFSPKEGRKYYATRMVCHIDKEYYLPVGIACYDGKDVLMEEYHYKDIKINIGLTEIDFSRKNKEYSF